MITTDELRKYYRFEMGPELFEVEDSDIEGICYITIEDAQQALKNMQARGTTAKEFAAWNEILEWNYQVECALRYCSKKAMKKLDFDTPWLLSDKTEADFLLAVSSVFRVMEDFIEEGRYPADGVDFLDYEHMLSDIALFRKGETDKIDPEQWSPIEMQLKMLALTDEDLNSADEATLERFRGVIDSLCETGNAEAMEKKAYCLYGGNAAYDCDWTASRDLLLALMKRDDVSDAAKCCFANTLGYIYYYGRCTEGKPDYDNAMRYFTLGLAGGYYESAYKIADMYQAGKGTDKNDRAAYNLVKWVYDHNLEAFLYGNPQTKFADAALRLGTMNKDGIGIRENHREAYELFMQANLALAMRAAAGGYIGDNKVLAAIRRNLDSMREEFPDAKPCKYAASPVPIAIGALFDGKADVEVTIKRTKKGLTLSAWRLQQPGALLTLPEYSYCEVINHAKQKARKVSLAWVKGSKKKLREGRPITFIANEIRACIVDCASNDYMIEFKNNGTLIARMTAKKYLFRVDWNGR